MKRLPGLMLALALASCTTLPAASTRQPGWVGA